MTQIVACITRDFVALAADRRLTDLRSGQLVDDEAAKLVVVGTQMAFAYTGLANVRPPPRGQSDLWLVSVFSPVPDRVPDFFTRLQAAATETFSRIAHLGPRAKRHAFVAVGWDYNGEEFEPFVSVVSNALADNGAWEPGARREFHGRATRLQGGDILIMPFGQPWTRDTAAWIRQQAVTPLDPAGALALLAATIRRTAAVNRTVGRGLQAIVLPRQTIGGAGGFAFLDPGDLVDGPDGLQVPNVSGPTAIYLPSDGNRGEVFMPHHVDRQGARLAFGTERVLTEQEIKRMYDEGLKRLGEAES